MAGPMKSRVVEIVLGGIVTVFISGITAVFVAGSKAGAADQEREEMRRRMGAVEQTSKLDHDAITRIDVNVQIMLRKQGLAP